MKETFTEIGSLFAQGGQDELKDWWKVAHRWISRLLIAILVWPVAMIACALWSQWMADKVIPIVALLPVLFFVYFIVKLINPATLAALALPKIRGALGNIFSKVAALIAVELILGLYLWLVPISNDRWLVPALALAVLAFFALRFADIGSGARVLLGLLMVGMTVVFMVGGRGGAGKAWRRSEAPTPKVANSHMGYNPEQICEGAYQRNYDHHDEENVDHYDITLTDGCFDAFFATPKSWHRWYYQPIGDVSGWWIAVWYSGWPPKGPFEPNQRPNFDNPPSRFWRFQGHGRVRIYTNDVVGMTTSVAIPNSASIVLTHLDIHDADPHICEKPDDAYYAHHGPEVPHPAGYHDYTNPKFLFDAKHGDNTVNWANGFKGTVPVCLIVDEKGMPDDIRLPQSPGSELETHIRDGVASMRYRPGMSGDDPIRVQIAIDIVFK